MVPAIRKQNYYIRIQDGSQMLAFGMAFKTERFVNPTGMERVRVFKPPLYISRMDTVKLNCVMARS